MRYRACTHARTPPYSLRSVRCLEALRWACAAYWPDTLFSFPHRVIYYGVPRVSAAEHRRRSSPADARRRQGGPLHGPPGDPDLLQVRRLFLLNLRCVRDSNPPLPSVTMPRLCPAYVLPTPRFCILMRLICPLHVDTLLTCALSCACYCIPFLCVSFGPVFFAPLPSAPFVPFYSVPFRPFRSTPPVPFCSALLAGSPLPCFPFGSVPFCSDSLAPLRSVWFLLFRFVRFCSAPFGSVPYFSLCSVPTRSGSFSSVLSASLVAFRYIFMKFSLCYLFKIPSR